MVEYDYWTDETEIMEYTEGLRNVLNCNEIYRTIFRCFKEKNMPALAENMVQMVKAIKDLQRQIKEENNNIEYLQKQLDEKETKLISLTAELGEMRIHKDNKDIQINNEIKALYEKYRSFRAVGKILNMDKSTVKRKLIKLGYSFD